MLDADSVSEVLFNFTQASFIDFAAQRKEIELSEDAARSFFDLLEREERITAADLTMLPLKQKAVAYELLTQYIMFLTMNKHLKFPTTFLEGSSLTVLNRPFLEYMCEYRWPFPQSLPW